MSGIRVPLGHMHRFVFSKALERATKRREMKPETLVRCARFLYGPSWGAKLGRALDPPVDSGDISKWRYGKVAIPEHYLDQVIFLADEKRREIADRLRRRNAA